MQVPPHLLHLKNGETIEARIESKVLTRLLVAALIRDGWHWFEDLSTMAFSGGCKLE
jgi:hypothetical protein